MAHTLKDIQRAEGMLDAQRRQAAALESIATSLATLVASKEEPAPMIERMVQADKPELTYEALHAILHNLRDHKMSDTEVRKQDLYSLYGEDGEAPGLERAPYEAGWHYWDRLRNAVYYASEYWDGKTLGEEVAT